MKNILKNIKYTWWGIGSFSFRSSCIMSIVYNNKYRHNITNYNNVNFEIE